MDKQLLDHTKTYCVGVSGGCDSMALLDMLIQNHYQVIVCHVNYHVRDDSHLDQATVENYCQQHHIPCYIREVQSEEYHQGNFEMQARDIRYAFYQQIINEHQCYGVILGHHQDDVLETILMQLERQQTQSQLGILKIQQIKGVKVIRPLLDVTKQQLMDYCHNHHIAYRDDITNFDDRYKRNYYRLHVLPQYTHQKKQALLQRMKIHNENNKQRQKELKPYFDIIDKEHKISLSMIKDKDLEYIIYYMVKKVVYPPLISQQLIQEIKKQILSKEPNIEVLLPVNFLFIKEYDNIYTSNKDKQAGYCIKYDQLVYDKHEDFIMCKEGHLNEGIYLKDEDFPITIRTYLPGDKIMTKGGHKKLSRLFINNKIPMKERKRWPVVVRSDGKIILIPHLAKNSEYLYTKPNVFVVKL